jgi:DNA-binding HxlR family transcriptional regulator
MYHTRNPPGTSSYRTYCYIYVVTTLSADPRACSVARTLEIVGEKWALLAVREVFLGNRRFDEMVRRTGAPRDTMTARLKTLVAAGVLERRPVSEHPPRFEYRLTPAGLDLYPVIVSLMQWGDRYLTNGEAPPMVLTHHCGHPLGAVTSCASCGEPVLARDVRPTPQREINAQH